MAIPLLQGIEGKTNKILNSKTQMKKYPTKTRKN
jgi:hypothetical protein